MRLVCLCGTANATVRKGVIAAPSVLDTVAVMPRPLAQSPHLPFRGSRPTPLPPTPAAPPRTPTLFGSQRNSVDHVHPHQEPPVGFERRHGDGQHLQPRDPPALGLFHRHSVLRRLDCRALHPRIHGPQRLAQPLLLPPRLPLHGCPPASLMPAVFSLPFSMFCFVLFFLTEAKGVPLRPASKPH